MFAGPWPFANYAGRERVKVPKHKYCEVELWSEFPNTDREAGEVDTIRVFGRADGIMQLVDDRRKIPIIYDCKRSPNEKPAYTIQLMLYNLGVARALERPFEQGVLWIVNRPHFAEVDETKFPIYHTTYADAKSLEESTFREFDVGGEKFGTVHGLQDLIVQNYKQQRRILSSRQSFLDAQKVCSRTTCAGAKDGQCGHPFNRQRCNLMRKLVKGGKHPRKFLTPRIAI